MVDIPSLEIKTREIAALVGLVDSSQDFLFRLLIGRLQPTTGSVRLSVYGKYQFD